MVELYAISHGPLSGRQRAVLALWVEGTLLGLNGCHTLALTQGLTVRRRQRELLYDDADRIDPGVPARSWRWSAASPRCCSGCAAGGCPRAGGKAGAGAAGTGRGSHLQDKLVALVISVVYRQHAIPAWHIVDAAKESPFLPPATAAGPGRAGHGAGASVTSCAVGTCGRIVALGWHP